MKLVPQLTIKSKLIMMLLLVSSTAIFIIAYLGYVSGQNNLRERIFSQLTSVRSSKADQIEAYFESVTDQTQTLAESYMIVSALTEFKLAYVQLENIKESEDNTKKLETYYQETFVPKLTQADNSNPMAEVFIPVESSSRYLQYHYIVNKPLPSSEQFVVAGPDDRSSYSRVHRRYHTIFSNLVQRYGFYDLFLINPDGVIIYSVEKEVDFATSLTTGPYQNTNLARAVSSAIQAKGKEFVKIVDFESFPPSYNNPAAFIAAPVFSGIQLVGVLAIQLSTDEIDKVMTGDGKWQENGLGQTGETYLVGADNLMRSTARVLLEDPEGYVQTLSSLGISAETINKIEVHQTSVLLQTHQTPAVHNALAGETDTIETEDFKGERVLSSYAPLHIADFRWVILSEMDLAEAYAPVYSFERTLVISAVLILLLITLLAMLLANLVTRPIYTLVDKANLVSEGNLDQITEFKSNDEFGELAESFNKMITNLRYKTKQIEKQNHENEQLLFSVFPTAVAKRLQKGETKIADHITNVTVLFSDVVGFSAMAKTQDVQEGVYILSDLVAAIDGIADKYEVEKIKTFGDGYMAVCGLSVPHLDHANRMIEFALEVRSIVKRFGYERGWELDIEIGLCSGDVTAGIVGQSKFTYDVWGPTVSRASKLQSACPEGAILVDDSVYQHSQEFYKFERFENANQDDIGNTWLLRIGN